MGLLCLQGEHTMHKRMAEDLDDSKESFHVSKKAKISEVSHATYTLLVLMFPPMIWAFIMHSRLIPLTLSIHAHSHCLAPTGILIVKLGPQECAICKQNLGSAYLTRLPCKHVFHSKCINKWLDKKSTCPLCRQKVPSVADVFSKLGEEINKIMRSNTGRDN